MQAIDLEKHSIAKLYFRYFIPSLCAMLALSTYSTIDGIFVGQKLGNDALAAVGIAWPVFPVLIAYELLFSIGAASLSSYYLGKNEPEKARLIFSSVFYFALLSSLLLGFVFFIFCDEIVIFLGASQTIAPLAAEYLEVIFLGSFVIVLHPLLDIFVMNDKRPVLAMVAMISGSLSNVVMNYFFIFVFEWGLFGSALATILGHFIGFLILFWHFISKKGQIYFIKAFKFFTLFKSAQNGIAQASAELSASVVMLIANHILGFLGGDRAIATYSVVMYSGIILFTALLSASQAIQPIASFNYGANVYARLVKILRFGCAFSLVLGSLMYVLSYLFSEHLVVLFLQKNEFGDIDEDFLAGCIEAMRIYFLGFILLGFNMSVASFFQSVQKPLSSFIVTISYTLVFVCIFFLILPSFFDIKGIFFSYPLAELCSFFVALAVIFWTFKKGSLKQNRNLQEVKAI
ncbi:MATE family efflux transporter [Campylobacter sp. MIT 97-5078]|uniref:MATE family efflux transporter n=1 Tax=Campylobacter sp. MIT 97-5078 TaxID=1548153 RepID=UPI0005130360|nr:MATE family efflux transporter [Campylobacter sp. MIT 97-5078]KGI56186.1 membrane protein [Campylobacter sp. MIT 97-5078]TQR25529.1 MATE family efflux transporter [Campylobacter sp. MIT 97-5078]